MAMSGRAGDVAKEEGGYVAGQEIHMKPIAFLNLTHRLVSIMG